VYCNDGSESNTRKKSVICIAAAWKASEKKMWEVFRTDPLAHLLRRRPMDDDEMKNVSLSYLMEGAVIIYPYYSFGSNILYILSFPCPCHHLLRIDIRIPKNEKF
jgi:hypothetical protein